MNWNNYEWTNFLCFCSRLLRSKSNQTLLPSSSQPTGQSVFLVGARIRNFNGSLTALADWGGGEEKGCRVIYVLLGTSFHKRWLWPIAGGILSGQTILRFHLLQVFKGSLEDPNEQNKHLSRRVTPSCVTRLLIGKNFQKHYCWSLTVTNHNAYMTGMLSLWFVMHLRKEGIFVIGKVTLLIIHIQF